MATRLYPHGTWCPYGVWSAGDATHWPWAGATPALLPRMLSPVRQSGGAVQYSSFQSGGGLTANSIVFRCISPPLQAQTISGTFKGQSWFNEGSATVNAMTQVGVRLMDANFAHVSWLWTPDTAALTSELFVSTTQYRNARVPRGGAQSLTSQTALAGYRLVIEVGVRFVAGGNGICQLMLSGNSTTDLPEDETTLISNVVAAGTVISNSWFEFSADILFAPDAGMATFPSYASPGPVAGDATPPTITSITPASGAISVSQSITATIADETALGRVEIYVNYTNIDRHEVAYDGTSFDTKYASSTMPGVNSRSLTLTRTTGWPDSFTLTIVATDAAGNVAEETASYTVPSFLPEVDNVSPAPGAISRDQAISFDITDITDLGAYYIFVSFDAVAEVAWDGLSWSPTFSTDSSASPISGGYSIVLDRTPGWIGDFELMVVARDLTGNLVAPSFSYTVASPYGTGSATFVNRVFDTVAGRHVFWPSSGGPDVAGAEYPGPGTFGVDTENFCVSSIAGSE